ncbi:MAG: cupin domain-containing protein [Polyangiaceae bacterium]
MRTNLFGGQGEVRVWQLLGAVVPPFDCALACELEPKGSVGTHVQQTSSELVFFLEGEGEVLVSKEVVSVGPGAIVGLLLGASLAIRNIGDIPLRYLIIKASTKPAP